MKESINIKSRVSIYQHEGEFDESKKTEENTIIKDQPNKFVDNILKHLRGFLALETTSEYTGVGYDEDWNMYLGTDGASTTNGQTSLNSPIGTAPGTPPDAKSGEKPTEIATGKWQSKFVCTWYSGSVSGTVEEIGLYLHCLSGYTFGGDITGSSSKVLSNRLSTGDGEYSSFTIDGTKSLTVEWRFIYEFE